MTSATDQTDPDPSRSHVVTAPLAEADLPEAEHIFRTAFGTFLGAPEPETFWSDRDYVRSRWRAPHVAALGAKHGGRLVGSNFATNRETVGFVGPLTVRADVQERGVGKALLASTMEQFDAWGPGMSGCSPSRTFRSSWRCIRSSGSTPAS